MFKFRFASDVDTRDKESWFRFWEVLGAITAMCIRNGKAGSWSGLGKTNTSPMNFEVEMCIKVSSGAGGRIVVEMGQVEDDQNAPSSITEQ